MAKGKKTNNKLKAKIMTSYAVTNSYNATAKEFKISPNTVKSIILKNSKEFAKVSKQKKELFLDKANRIIDKSLFLLEKRFDKALDNEQELDTILSAAMSLESENITQQEKASIIKKINKLELNSLSEITTSMGTLYDKMRLARGESTHNVEGNLQLTYEQYLQKVADKDEY